MSKQLTIVIVRAPGYSGATWVNTLLGCHERAMAMGPPNRFWKLGSDMAEQACMIHREKCTVWPGLIRQPPQPGDWFAALADVTGKDTFILNYPDREFYESVIQPANARVLDVKVVRDGRASLYSRMRHHDSHNQSDVFRNIMDWQIPKWRQIEHKLPENLADYHFLRYEDLLTNPHQTLDAIGCYIGLDYDAGAAPRFWEWEHHLTAGNVGMLDMICRLQGLPGYEHARRAEYDKVIERIRAGGPAVFLDESWQHGLTERDRLVFDCLLGEWNAAHGYPRDSFSAEDIDRFWSRFEHVCALLYDELAATGTDSNRGSPGDGRRLLDMPRSTMRRVVQRVASRKRDGA